MVTLQVGGALVFFDALEFHLIHRDRSTPMCATPTCIAVVFFVLFVRRAHVTRNGMRTRRQHFQSSSPIDPSERRGMFPVCSFCLLCSPTSAVSSPPVRQAPCQRSSTPLTIAGTGSLASDAAPDFHVRSPIRERD